MENNNTPTSSSSTAQVKAETQSKTSQPLDGASCSAIKKIFDFGDDGLCERLIESQQVWCVGETPLNKLLREFEECGQRGIEMDNEHFKNRQPKGYQHLPRLVDDLREMSNLLPTQTHDQMNQDEHSLLRGLLHS